MSPYGPSPARPSRPDLPPPLQLSRFKLAWPEEAGSRVLAPLSLLDLTGAMDSSQVLNAMSSQLAAVAAGLEALRV